MGSNLLNWETCVNDSFFSTPLQLIVKVFACIFSSANDRLALKDLSFIEADELEVTFYQEGPHPKQQIKFNVRNFTGVFRTLSNI